MPPGPDASELLALCKSTEEAHTLPPGILSAMAIHESGLNPWAIRYEPGFYKTYIKHRAKKELGGVWPAGVSEETERTARATSFGLIQVMGQVAREMGADMKFLTELCAPSTGLSIGAQVLRRQLTRYNGDVARALSAYNAGTATRANHESYVAPILARMT